MATITLNTHGTSPDSWASNFPGTTLNITTNSVSIRVNHPLYGGMFAGDIGRWTEKDGKIGNEVNWETEGFTFDGLSTGANYLRLYAVDADGEPESNTGPDNNLGPYWVSAVTVNVSSPPSCSFSSTPTVNPDIIGDTGATSGADATTARVSTNWSSACSKTVAWATVTSTATPGQFISGTDVSVARGNDVYLYAGASGVTNYLRSAATTIPYLSPKRTGITIANAPVIASADTGYWTATLSGVDTTKHTNYAVASSASVANSSTLITDGYDHNDNGLDTMSTGVNGSTITVNQTTINTSVSNAPVGTGTTTMYLWCSRTSPSGGSGGQGWGPISWMPVLDGSGNTLSFTVTRSNENVQNSTGSYYDTSTDTGAKHSVTLTGLVAGKYYNVADAGGNGGSATWANGSSAATATLTINDAAQTVPSGTGSTTTTYTIWSNSTASWSGASSLGTTYTRTLLNYDRYTPPGMSLDTGVNSGTYTLENTISGHTYYIRKSSTTGAIVGQATATGTSTNFTITLASGDLGNTAGNQATLYLTITSPFNESPGSDYNSGKTIVVTRTSTTQQAARPSSDYGMKIWNSSNTLIYDTTSKIGRIAITGRTASVNGQDSSAWVTVTGMENTSNWNVIVQPYESAATTGVQQRLALNFSITKESNRFKINNEQDTPPTQSNCATSYDYIVMRSG